MAATASYFDLNARERTGLASFYHRRAMPTGAEVSQALIDKGCVRAKAGTREPSALDYELTHYGRYCLGLPVCDIRRQRKAA